MDRTKGKASVCCSTTHVFKTLDRLYNSDLYSDAEDYTETCESLLDENQADKSTKLPTKLLKKKDKKRFMAMCVLLQLQRDDDEVRNFS